MIGYKEPPPVSLKAASEQVAELREALEGVDDERVPQLIEDLDALARALDEGAEPYLRARSVLRKVKEAAK